LIEEQLYRQAEDLAAGIELEANIEFLFALSPGTPAGTALKERLGLTATNTQSSMVEA
jgi:hypothetical protein